MTSENERIPCNEPCATHGILIIGRGGEGFIGQNRYYMHTCDYDDCYYYCYCYYYYHKYYYGYCYHYYY